MIHTVCPRYIEGSETERKLLAVAYRSALAFHDRVPDAIRISFVSMGTGIYQWPLELAAEIAVGELSNSMFEETYMCVIDEATRASYQRASDALTASPKHSS